MEMIFQAIIMTVAIMALLFAFVMALSLIVYLLVFIVEYIQITFFPTQIQKNEKLKKEIERLKKIEEDRIENLRLIEENKQLQEDLNKLKQ